MSSYVLQGTGWNLTLRKYWRNVHLIGVRGSWWL